MSTDLNKEIAKHFLSDARDFLQRYSVVPSLTGAG
jgi:hypothetical protein